MSRIFADTQVEDVRSAAASSGSPPIPPPVGCSLSRPSARSAATEVEAKDGTGQCRQSRQHALVSDPSAARPNVATTTKTPTVMSASMLRTDPAGSPRPFSGTSPFGTTRVAKKGSPNRTITRRTLPANIRGVGLPAAAPAVWAVSCTENVPTATGKMKRSTIMTYSSSTDGTSRRTTEYRETIACLEEKIASLEDEALCSSKEASISRINDKASLGV